MASDRTELMRTGIGLLTLVHGAIEQGKREDFDGAGIMSALQLLRQNITDFSMTFPDIPPESLDLMQQVGRAVASEYETRVDWLMLGLLKGFMDVVRSYLDDRPDADVGAILQRAALDMPS